MFRENLLRDHANNSHGIENAGQIDPGPRRNIKTIFSRYEDSHVKGKTVMRPSYLYYGDPYAGNTVTAPWSFIRKSSG